jgi:hypothetical protein
MTMAEAPVAGLRQALERQPEDMALRQMLVQALERTGQLGEALQRLEERREACLARIPLQFLYLKLLTRRGRTADASIAAEALLHSAASIDEMPGIVRMLPELGGKPVVIRLATLAAQRLEAFEEPAPARQALRHELRLRLALLRGDLAGFRDRLDRLQARDLPAGLHEAYRLHAARLETPAHEALRAPKVFGIGLSKTASHSLSLALSTLGLRSAHYQNPLSFELLDADEALHFDACNDTPVTHCFETLYFSFPRSRFVYTTRPLGDWQASLRTHHQHHFGTDRWDELRTLTANCAPPAAAVEASLYFNHADAEAAWRAHDSRVRRFFADKPGDRFLEFDVFAGDGWPRLCAFLGLPEPAAAFPHENAVR